ncbi:MFS transporter, partial [Modestobacter versicolor]
LMAFVTVGWAAQFAWDSGVPAATAGWLLALSLALAVPVSLVVPRLATRLASPRPVVVALALCYLAGYLVMLTAPVAGACVWAVLLGVGGGTYPLALTLIGLRSDTPAQTASLSAFVQGAGYLLAATGPLLVGRLYAGTGWTGPFVVLFAALALQLGCGWHAARPVPRPGLSAAAPEPVAHV